MEDPFNNAKLYFHLHAAFRSIGHTILLTPGLSNVCEKFRPKAKPNLKKKLLSDVFILI